MGCAICSYVFAEGYGNTVKEAVDNLVNRMNYFCFDVQYYTVSTQLETRYYVKYWHEDNHFDNRIHFKKVDNKWCAYLSGSVCGFEV
jgi:hypothetical protein